MGVRVIFRTDVLNAARPENFATLINNQLSPPAVPPSGAEPLSCLRNKRTGDKIDSFTKIRLSPKTFRFSGRFGRSKSEVERCSSEPYHNYTSKSFQDVSFYIQFVSKWNLTLFTFYMGRSTVHLWWKGCFYFMVFIGIYLCCWNLDVLIFTCL